MIGNLIELTPTISTSAYSTGDQLGTLMTLTGFSQGGSYLGVLHGITIVDKAKQSKPLDILFFDEAPTIASSDNAAVDISDAEMVDKCIGHISIVAGDYISLANSTVAFTLRSGHFDLKPKKDGTIYALAVSRDTPTYGSTSDLVFKFLVRWDT